MDLTVKLFDIDELWVVLDGTGHSCDQTSPYLRLIKSKNKIKKWRKS
jgi:hypothetical protein